ncbi:MAG: XylR family transcriptional regulator [Planctomycetaceae bacterium]
MRRRSVALLIETSNSYARGLLDGIIAWERAHEAWSIYLPERERGASPKSLEAWRGDGVIARIETADIANAVQELDVPVVDVSAARHVSNVPWVETNDRAVSTEAFEHLQERGFRHFAFCGDPGFNWSNWRRDAFVELVTQAGGDCLVHDSLPLYGANYSWTHERKRLETWVQSLPRPIGIMACYDIKAQQLLDVCRDLDIPIPEELAVIGVDDDRLVCELSHPPLSSVAPNTYRTGYEAAALLDRMMAGESVPAEAHLIVPIGVTARQSTDVLAIDDADVVAALRYIREHACHGISVADVLRRVPVSRRQLESKFSSLLGRTPHAEILRLRMDRTKRLLAETDLSLSEIAHLVGFQHTEYLSVAFKREVGSTPRDFRVASRP